MPERERRLRAVLLCPLVGVAGAVLVGVPFFCCAMEGAQRGYFPMSDAFLDPQADDQKLLAQVIDHYHHTLKESPAGQNYLLRRGINDPKAIDHFRVGLVDYSLVNVLPSYQRATGKAIRARLQGLGLMRSSSHQQFKGCLVFPIMAADGSGRVVDIYGRRLSQGLKPASPRHRHLSETRQGVWNIAAFAETDEVILCPSLFDGLTFWNAGYRNVSCTFGPEALTEDHLIGAARVQHPAGVPDEREHRAATHGGGD